MVQEEIIIHVQWEGPFSLNQLTDLDEASDYGIYQIYGTHPVYGSNVLLYIGKAELQTFRARIGQESWAYNQDSQRISIYVGRLAGSETPEGDAWNQQISDIEKLLIYAHGPAYNSSNISTIKDHQFRSLHILNWGQHRDLLPEVSGHRWTDRHDDIEGYDVYEVGD